MVERAFNMKKCFEGSLYRNSVQNQNQQETTPPKNYDENINHGVNKCIEFWEIAI